MKRIAILVLLTLMWSISSASTELKVGEKAADFILKDSLGKEYTLNSTEFYGRVVYINYSDISSKDMNKHVDTSLKEDTGIDRKSNYVGFGIANMKASIVPDFIIARVIKSKQQETGATILLDENYTIMNLWGLKNHSSNVVVLDKNRICRYIYKGKLPTEEVAKLIKIYQVK